MSDTPPNKPTDSTERTVRPQIVSSRDLLAGHREVIIQHGTEHYRLRLTNSNKLILVK